MKRWGRLASVAPMQLCPSLATHSKTPRAARAPALLVALALLVASPAAAQHGRRHGGRNDTRHRGEDPAAFRVVHFRELQLIRLGDDSVALHFAFQSPREGLEMGRRGAQLLLQVMPEGRRGRAENLAVPLNGGGDVALPRSARGEVQVTVQLQGARGALRAFSPGPGVGAVESMTFSSRYVPHVQPVVAVAPPPGRGGAVVTVQPNGPGQVTVRQRSEDRVTVRQRGGVVVTTTSRSQDYSAEIIRTCGEVFHGTATQQCIGAVQGYVGHAPSLIRACGAFIGQSNELRCVQVGASALTDVSGPVAACEDAFTGNPVQLRCVEIVSRSGRGDAAAVIQACDDAFVGDQNALQCLERSL